LDRGDGRGGNEAERLEQVQAHCTGLGEVVRQLGVALRHLLRCVGALILGTEKNNVVHHCFVSQLHRSFLPRHREATEKYFFFWDYLF
jgi:hypothetical protein